MESPSTWDLLTASLAVLDLDDPHSAWSFLVVQGLVHDAGSEREQFAAIVRHEQSLDVTGPSIAARIAAELSTAGIATSAGGLADPWGRRAAARLCQIAAWDAVALGHRNLESLQQWRDRDERE